MSHTITEEECLARIRFATERLWDQLEDTRKDRDRAAFDAEVATWAIKGMVGYHLRMMLPDFAQIKGNEILEIADHLGKRAAHELLHGAGVAFKDHAEMYRLRSHIQYLENHARNCGVSFHEWTEREPESIPEKVDWPTRVSTPAQNSHYEIVAYRREWEGDVSDLNNWIYEEELAALDEPVERWQVLYAKSEGSDS